MYKKTKNFEEFSNKLNMFIDMNSKMFNEDIRRIIKDDNFNRVICDFIGVEMELTRELLAKYLKIEEDNIEGVSYLGITTIDNNSTIVDKSKLYIEHNANKDAIFGETEVVDIKQLYEFTQKYNRSKELYNNLRYGLDNKNIKIKGVKI